MKNQGTQDLGSIILTMRGLRKHFGTNFFSYEGKEIKIKLSETCTRTKLERSVCNYGIKIYGKIQVYSSLLRYYW